MDLPQVPRPVHRLHEFVPLGSPAAINSDIEAVIKLSTLCSRCRPIRSWLQTNLDGLTNQDTKKGPQHSFDHHASGSLLETAYQEGCHLCSIFWHALTEPQDLKRKPAALTKVRKGKDVTISFQCYSSRMTLLPFVKLAKTKMRGMQIDLETRNHRRDTKLKLLCSVEKGNDRQPIEERNQSLHSLSTASGLSLGLALEWIEICTKLHKDCTGTKPTTLPSRLIDVSFERAGDGNLIRVVPSYNISNTSKYAALGYCWGKSQSPFTLQCSNFDVLASGISTQLLPKTIQDAIGLTKRLGLQWLWVDSLCIIQDSIDDWNYEAARMCEVYQNSFITIAALGAQDSNQGLYSQRDPLMYLSCSLGETEAGNSILVSPFHQFRNRSEVWPLHRRGWVVQERVLSPRILGLGTYLSWTCRERIVTEFGEKLPLAARRSLGSEFFASVLQQKITVSKTRNEDRIYQVWREILAAFTEASITVETDRLTALSGIISTIQNQTGWRNIKGLWAPFLENELIWKNTNNKLSQRSKLRPSWSWAAITGGVAHSISSSSYLESFVDIQDLDSSELNGTQYKLRLSCAPIKVDDAMMLNTSCSVGSPFWMSSFKLSSKLDLIYMPDVQPPELSPPLILPISGRYSDRHWGFGEYEYTLSGLAVSPSADCPGFWERVGYAGFTWHCDRLDTVDMIEEARSMLRDKNRSVFITLV